MQGGAPTSLSDGDQASDRLLTINQTVQQFNLTTGLLYAAIARGEIPAVRFRTRGRIRLRDVDVRDWIERHTSGTACKVGPQTAPQHDLSESLDIERFLPPKTSRRFAG